MKPETVLLLVQFAPFTIALAIVLWQGIGMWRDWRRHRRVMAVFDEVDRALILMHKSQNPEQLRAHGERVLELLEHADQLQNKK